MSRAPVYPEQCYDDEWKGWAYLFGTGPAKPRRPFQKRQPKRTLKQWVQFAENLAAQHGGMLPNPGLLCKTHGSLYGVMRRHPEVFAHIPQERQTTPHKTLEGWVLYAEELAAQNGGKLPNAKFLKTNHSSLYKWMKKNREAFMHISRERLREPYKPLEEWVCDAKDLAEQHGGKLPNAKFLQKNHGRLYSVMLRHRNAFAYFPRRRIDRWGNEITNQPFAKERCHA